MISLNVNNIVVSQSRDREPTAAIQRRLALAIRCSYTGENDSGVWFNAATTFCVDGFEQMPDSTIFFGLQPGRTEGEKELYLGIPIIPPDRKEIGIVVRDNNRVLCSATVTVLDSLRSCSA